MAKILIVDDEEDICSLLRDLFLDWGHTVSITNNGADAMYLLRKENPDVVFLDRRMPGMAGRDVLKQMHSDGIASRVIVMTADLDQDTYEEMKALGALEIIPKPFEISKMKSQLTKILPSVFV